MGYKMRGVQPVSAVLGRLRKSIAQPSSGVKTKMLKRAAAIDAKQNRRTFADERDPRTGDAWLPLEDENPHYAKWKRRNWPGKKLLVWTGRGRDAATKKSAPGRIARWSGGKIQLGTSDPNAVKHQEGESYSPTKMVFLREKKPRFVGGRFVRRNGKRTKQRKTGRNWFTLWMDELPARPFIGKTAEGASELRGVVAAEQAREFVRLARQGGIRANLAKASGTAGAGRFRIRR